MYKVIVVGGGAAGLMAAGKAAESGAEVILFEKKERPGRKIRISGKGRCNLTNTAEISDFIGHFGKNGKFLRQAFARFFSYDLISFLGELGVATELERGGRVFPANNDAQTVVSALVSWAKSQSVSIYTKSPIRKLCIEDNRICGVYTDTFYPADAVIITTGGKSYPATGSTGDGYRFAESAGHTIIPVRPALVPLETEGKTAPLLQGLSLKNVNATVWVDGKKQAQKFGEMLFTHFGLSGPIILSLSGAIVDALIEKKRVELSIDLKPALDEQKLDKRIRRDINEHPNQYFQSFLKGLLPNKLISVCIELTGIDFAKPMNQLTAKERKLLIRWLKDFRFTVVGHRDFSEAIVTAGGVRLNEINPRTMESKLVSGLYFAGEVLDLNGDTGGYNLQAAFSTGWLAGISCRRHT